MGYNPNYKWNVCRVNPHQSLGWTNPLTKWDIHINHWGYNPLTKWDEPPSSIPLFGRKLQFIAPLPTGPTPDISSAPNLAQQTDLTWSRTRLWNRAVPRGLSIKHWQYINEYMGCYGYVCVCIYYIYTIYIHNIHYNQFVIWCLFNAWQKIRRDLWDPSSDGPEFDNVMTSTGQLLVLKHPKYSWVTCPWYHNLH